MDYAKELNRLNEMCANTLMSHLGITYTEIGEDYLLAEMNIDSRHCQPKGILHGGASMALAESAGSALSVIKTDQETEEVKGMEINANHIRSVKAGKLHAKAKFKHVGKISHVIEVEITNENKKPVCVCRITNIITKKNI
ncbi:MAG: hotdog fold thioesterase [Marinifilaceae bacterium]|jgi:uncharacterized protein (TIGR00369 family)|nr:hotdog fold thioesterase [Marinifilaceae bacterium]